MSPERIFIQVLTGVLAVVVLAIGIAWLKSIKPRPDPNRPPVTLTCERVNAVSIHLRSSSGNESFAPFNSVFTFSGPVVTTGQQRRDGYDIDCIYANGERIACAHVKSPSELPNLISDCTANP